MQTRSKFSRREVLAAGSAAAAMTTLSPVFAQTGASGAPPVVLITGTSSGFGRLMAESFARDGLRVVATMRETTGRNAPAAEELGALAAGEGLAIDVVEIDVTSDASVERGVGDALQRAGRVDVLVNNAGIIVPGPVELQPVGYFDANFETNVNGSLRVFRALAPQMREHGTGYVVQISSGVSRFVIPGGAGYCGSKAAIETAAEALAIENSGFGIDVTIVQVAGSYKTRFNANGLATFEAMLAALPVSDKPRLAAFQDQIEAIRAELHSTDALDPTEVVDGVLRLIRMEHGNRPRRHVIGPYAEAVAPINRAHDEAQAAMGR